MRFSSGTPALRSIMAVWTSTAQRHGVDHAAKLDDRAVAGALDHAPMVHGDDRVEQVAAERPEPRKRAVFVRSCEPAIAGDVGHQNRCELAGLAHGAPLRRHSD